jgi:hypothetical protein
MLTIGKVVEDIINRSPFLREAITEELINISSLARKIKSETEEILKRDVKEGAIVMAIKRMSPGSYHKINMKIKNFLGDLGDYLVRSDLEDITFSNSDTIRSRQAELMSAISNEKDYYMTICRGIGETTIISSKTISPIISRIFKGEEVKSQSSNLASVTIKLPKTNTEISGIYYYILKHLAWEGINIIEVVSTSNEFTIVVSINDIDITFSVLMRLKKTQI